jgi:hypothetical protein
LKDRTGNLDSTKVFVHPDKNVDVVAIDVDTVVSQR